MGRTNKAEKSVEDIVQERLNEFTQKLMILFPDKEYELRKLANEISYSGLDGVSAQKPPNLFAPSENPLFDFINDERGYALTAEDMARVPGFITGDLSTSEVSVAVHAVVEKLQSELSTRENLTLHDIANILEERVRRLRSLNRIRELGGVKILHEEHA